MTSLAARLVVACGLLAGTTALCVVQTYTPPPPPLTTLPPCPADKDAKKRAKRKDCDPTVYPSETVQSKGKKDADSAVTPSQKNPSAANPAVQAHPYPGDTSADIPSDSGAPKKPDVAPAGAAHPYPGDNGKDLPGSDVPHDPAAEKRAADTPAGKANPFPEGSSPDMPSDPAEPASKADDPASSSSGAVPADSSSSSSSDDATTKDSSRKSTSQNPDDDNEDQPKLTDKGSEGKRNNKVIKPQTDTDRVDEDLTVAKFYGQSGNYMGAYLRARDAVRTQPDFPEGHFVLGEAAKRLNKKDEAVAEFQTYLKLAPDGRQARAAEKALDDLK